MTNRTSVVCFGEILWDVLPDQSMPGGAPMNVAYHLNNLGIDTNLISCVGDDEKGKELLSILERWSLSTKYCQVDKNYKTSEVVATEGDNHEMKYEILHPVAWDFIRYNNNLKSLVEKADAFVFGSLVTRSIISQKTLLLLLESAKYTVFDINIRSPHYSTITIKQLLKKTNLLKLNDNELVDVGKFYNKNVETPQDAVRMLQNDFGIKEIIVTSGSRGSTYITPNDTISQIAYSVKVADTIGSGDSFLAGFLSKKLKGETAEAALSFAATLASFVTSHHGACPAYTIDELQTFKENLE
jgi:fructokinase